LTPGQAEQEAILQRIPHTPSTDTDIGAAAAQSPALIFLKKTLHRAKIFYMFVKPLPHKQLPALRRRL
jgi:hypothetical protein